MTLKPLDPNDTLIRTLCRKYDLHIDIVEDWYKANPTDISRLLEHLEQANTVDYLKFIDCLVECKPYKF